MKPLKNPGVIFIALELWLPLILLLLPEFVLLLPLLGGQGLALNTPPVVEPIFWLETPPATIFITLD